MKELFIKFTLIVSILSIFSSCMTTKTSVGEYKQLEGDVYTYAKAKQIWLFWGIVPIGRTDVATPTDGNCEIVTRKNVTDVIITILTVGIVTTHTIKVHAKKIKSNGS